jgi:hypothetical protein
MNKYSDPDPGSGIKHPGSATLTQGIQSLITGIQAFANLNLGLELVSQLVFIERRFPLSILDERLQGLIYSLPQILVGGLHKLTVSKTQTLFD